MPKPKSNLVGSDSPRILTWGEDRERILLLRAIGVPLYFNSTRFGWIRLYDGFSTEYLEPNCEFSLFSGPEQP